MSVVTVNEGTPPPVNTRSYVWNASTQKWDETITPVARAEADWPALISLPNGLVYDADTTDVYLSSEELERVNPNHVGAAPKYITVTTP